MAPRIPGVTPYKQNNRIVPAQAVAGSSITDIPGALTSSTTADVVDSSRDNVNRSMAANRRVMQSATESLANAAGMPKAFVQAGSSVDLSGLAAAGAKLAETFQTINRKKTDAEFAQKAEVLMQDSQDIITRQDGGLITFQRMQKELVDAYRDRVSPEVLMSYLPRITNTAITINKEVIAASAKAAKELAETQQNKEVQAALIDILPAVISAGTPYASPDANQAAFAAIDAWYNKALTELSPATAALAYTNLVEAVLATWTSNAPQIAAKKQELFANADYLSQMTRILEEVDAGNMSTFQAAAESARIAAETGATDVYKLNTFEDVVRQNIEVQEAAAKAQQLIADTQSPAMLEAELQEVIVQNDNAISIGGLYFAYNPADFDREVARLKVMGIDLEESPTFSAMKSVAVNVRRFQEEEPKEWERVQSLIAASRMQGARNAQEMQDYATRLQQSTLTLLTDVTTLTGAGNIAEFESQLRQKGFATPEAASNFLIQTAQEYAALDPRDEAARRALLQKYNDTLAVFTSVAKQEVGNALTTYESKFAQFPDLATRGLLLRSNSGRYSLIRLDELEKNYTSTMGGIYGAITDTNNRLEQLRQEQARAGTTTNFW